MTAQERQVNYVHTTANMQNKLWERACMAETYVMLMLLLVFFAANANDDMGSLAFEQIEVTMKETKKGLMGMWLPKSPKQSEPGHFCPCSTCPT